jgi:molybdopterin converting factor small subunit
MMARAMVITARYLLGLGKRLGRTEDHVVLPHGASMKVLLEELARRHGPPFREHILDRQTGHVQTRVLVLINGLSLSRLQGLDTVLAVGDVVVFTHPLSGG